MALVTCWWHTKCIQSKQIEPHLDIIVLFMQLWVITHDSPFVPSYSVPTCTPICWIMCYIPWIIVWSTKFPNNLEIKPQPLFQSPLISPLSASWTDGNPSSILSTNSLESEYSPRWGEVGDLSPSDHKDEKLTLMIVHKMSHRGDKNKSGIASTKKSSKTWPRFIFDVHGLYIIWAHYYFWVKLINSKPMFRNFPNLGFKVSVTK